MDVAFLVAAWFACCVLTIGLAFAIGWGWTPPSRVRKPLLAAIALSGPGGLLFLLAWHLNHRSRGATGPPPP